MWLLGLWTHTKIKTSRKKGILQWDFVESLLPLCDLVWLNELPLSTCPGPDIAVSPSEPVLSPWAGEPGTSLKPRTSPGISHHGTSVVQDKLLIHKITPVERKTTSQIDQNVPHDLRVFLEGGYLDCKKKIIINSVYSFSSKKMALIRKAFISIMCENQRFNGSY